MLCTEYHSTATFTPASHKQIPLHQHHSSPSNFIQMKHKHCGTDNVIFDHRVHKEWQLPLSSVHSIMMENLAQPGEGGGARPSPFTISSITCKVAEYTLHLRGQIHSPYFYSTSICTTGHSPILALRKPAKAQKVHCTYKYNVACTPL